MSTEIQLLDANALSNTLEKNQNLADRAIKALRDAKQLIPSDLKKVAFSEGNDIESKINTLIVKGSDTIKIAKERRMVFTKKFDELKSTFTNQEKEVDAEVTFLKGFVKSWNTEKYERQKREEQEREQKRLFDNEIIKYKASVRSAVYNTMQNDKSDKLNAMDDAFYGAEIDKLDALGDRLRKFKPKYKIDSSFYMQNVYSSSLINAETQDKIIQQTIAAIEQDIVKVYVDDLTEHTQDIIEKIPSRKLELERAAKDVKAAQAAKERIAKERVEKEEREAKERAEKAAQIQRETEVAKMDAAFESVTAQQDTTLSKGATIKKKYAPADHKQMLAILGWWVSTEMNKMSLEDVTKKLSFMRTAASDALNKGVVIEGVDVVEDVRTRTSRK